MNTAWTFLAGMLTAFVGSAVALLGWERWAERRWRAENARSCEPTRRRPLVPYFRPNLRARIRYAHPPHWRARYALAAFIRRASGCEAVTIVHAPGECYVLAGPDEVARVTLPALPLGRDVDAGLRDLFGTRPAWLGNA